jgi:hypothetical protein
VDQKQYAIKVVRLHIRMQKGVDPMTEIYRNRVYTELQAASRITSDNIVRYFNSWFEELTQDEKMHEQSYKQQFKDKIKSIQKRKAKRRHNQVSVSSSISRSFSSKHKLSRSLLRISKQKKGKKMSDLTRSLIA